MDSRLGLRSRRPRPLGQAGRRFRRLRQRQVEGGERRSRPNIPITACHQPPHRRRARRPRDHRRAVAANPRAGKPRAEGRRHVPAPISTSRRSTPPASPRRKPYLDADRSGETMTSSPTLFGGPAFPIADRRRRRASTAATPTATSSIVGFGGLGLPDRDNYLVDNERNREMRAKYLDYLAFLLGKAGYADPRATRREGLRPREEDGRGRVGPRESRAIPSSPPTA